MERVPALALPESELGARETYQFIHDAIMLDGNPRMNLATFVSTWMEPEARDLMAEAFDKNAVDHDEYPSTAAIERRCVSMVADLFHAPGLDGSDPASATGVSTIGSSEAVMLAGLALKWRHRARSATPPNLVLGSNVQVVWEKFCRYLDVEPRYLPMEPGRYVVTPEQVRQAAADGVIDEGTIGVVAILGTTISGEYEDVAGIAAVLDEVAAAGGPDVPIHVDAASGGFVAPFVDPDLLWDFRVPRVASINVSGHKYGLTYPGIGFAVWRSPEDLPDELVFHVDYLGGDMPTFTFNFSRPGNQIVGQYYNFLRLGRRGYRRIMESLRETARWVAARLGELEGLEIVTDGSALPVVTVVAADGGPDVYALSHELRAHGWLVPAYAMPEGADGVHVLRIVVREGFSGELAAQLVEDVRASVAELAGAEPRRRRGFAH